MYFLTEKLPKPNYTPVKVVYLDRKNFFNTIAGDGDIHQSEDYAKKLPSINKANRSNNDKSVNKSI